MCSANLHYGYQLFLLKLTRKFFLSWMVSTMTTTYKYKSRLITAIAFIIMLLAAITPDAWQSLLPNQYWVFIPTIMGIITYAAAQLSEEKRVEVAETMVIEKQNAIMGQPLNEEYTFPSEEEET